MCLQVLQETEISRPAYSQLVSPNNKTIAMVDRTANLTLAAEQLVTARFAFGGTSPYAPDLVFVNEFVKEDFLEHVLKHSIRFLTGSNGALNDSSITRGPKKSSPIAESFQVLSDSKKWRLNIVTQGDNGAILELSNPCALPPKSSQPMFCISSMTSLEHAISIIDEDSEPQDTLLAAYHFGTSQAGKYLSQFINADASFVNHVPFRLLLGPAAPSFHPIDVEMRYTTRQFTRSSLAFIIAPSAQTDISDVLTSNGARKAAAQLLSKATQEIREKKRPECIAIGNFEQGILVGLGVYGIPLATCVGASLFFGVRAGLRRWVFD